MEEVKQNKSRTAITISPKLWAAAKERCAELAIERQRKMSFSMLVEEALRAYLGRSDV